MAQYSALETALYLLGFKDRTKKELNTKLHEKGYDDKEIELAIDKISEYGYINDEAYARRYIKSRINKKGSKLIVRELQSKGISTDVINEQLDEMDVDVSDIIVRTIEKKYSNFDYKDITVRQKVVSYFLRRGYCYVDINNALNRWQEANC